MRTRIPGAVTVLGLVVSLGAAASAQAAQVTVNVRIEGKTQTLFEQVVTTDTRTLDGHDGSGPHVCDGTNAGHGGAPSPTAGAALAAAGDAGLTFKATYTFRSSFDNSLIDDFFLVTAGGETPDYNVDQTFWNFLVDGVSQFTGPCQRRVTGFEDVVYAVGKGSENPLYLTGPASANAGEAFRVNVLDEVTGSPIQGAQVGGQTTGPDGTATVTLTTLGQQTLKATKAGSFRSPALRVCVHNGNDGTCGTVATGGGTTTTGGGTTGTGGGTTTTGTGTGTTGTGTTTTQPPPYRAVQASLAGFADGATFTLARAPRVLQGEAQPGSNGLSRVRIRLRRKAGSVCSFFSVLNERFYRRPCGDRGFFYTLPVDGTAWSYLLPLKLAAGAYRLESFGVDRANNPGPTVARSFTVKAAAKKP